MKFSDFKFLVFLFALLSLCLLLLATFFLTPPRLSVSNFLRVPIKDKVICLEGEIRDLKQYNTTYFFNLCDGSKCVECIFFNPTIYQKYLLFETNLVLVTGKFEDKYLIYKIESDWFK